MVTSSWGTTPKNISLYRCTYIYIYTYMCVCVTYICMYVYMYIYIFIYLYYFIFTYFIYLCRYNLLTYFTWFTDFPATPQYVHQVSRAGSKMSQSVTGRAQFHCHWWYSRKNLHSRAGKGWKKMCKPSGSPNLAEKVGKSLRIPKNP